MEAVFGALAAPDDHHVFLEVVAVRTHELDGDRSAHLWRAAFTAKASASLVSLLSFLRRHTVTELSFEVI